jgi:hypothetical protein
LKEWKADEALEECSLKEVEDEECSLEEVEKEVEDEECSLEEVDPCEELSSILFSILFLRIGFGGGVGLFVLFLWFLIGVVDK